MGIMNLFGKKDSANEITKGPPYSISTELVPYKLHAKMSSNALLIVKVRNLTKDVLMTSVVAKVPGKLGFDEMVMQKEKEVRVGDMQPAETKEIEFKIYSSIGSEVGDYTLALTTFAHYRDYAHVLNSIRKDVTVSLI
ncbi:MAG: hypothetical protein ABSA33_00165 [Candidatus Micrarchaeaceae archaeon]|jgi:hypothetical protein